MIQPMVLHCDPTQEAIDECGEFVEILVANRLLVFPHAGVMIVPRYHPSLGRRSDDD